MTISGDTYPRIRVSGAPFERGRAYGAAAREQVHRSIAAYESVFDHYAGWPWARVTAEALRFEDAIGAYEPRYLDEIRGIAVGAAVSFDDVLALNVRTEVMFAASARQAAEQSRRVHECSSFAVLPAASVTGHTLMGQNWDWLPHAFDTVVVLEVEQDDRPNFVTVVEAGLLAKVGINSSGLGLVANALITDRDVGEAAVPFHVVLRGILDATTITDALKAIQRRPRSSSANYLIGHRDGLALDVEAAPGDYSHLHLIYPTDGVILHTNHFQATGFADRDVSIWAMPDTPFRLERLHELVDRHGSSDIGFWQGVLADHAGHPFGICCHPDQRVHQHDQGATVAAVTYDLDAGELWIAHGQPCSHPFERLEDHVAA